MSRQMLLAQLADGLFVCDGLEQKLVSGLTKDSRSLIAGDLFIAVPGLTAHGLSYLNAEQAQKAAAILFELPVPENVIIPVNAIPVDGLTSMQAEIANRFFDSPSAAMTVIGVTGTNGKTSTVQMIAQAMSELGKTAGTIGTLGTGLYGQVLAGERTTPDVVAVHRALAEMRDAGAQLVAMEVSSHALEQGRVDGVTFTTAVFSNLTLDHLDYHGTMQAYFDAKAKLFAWTTLQHAVINVDDNYGEQLIEKLSAKLQVIATSSRHHAAANLRATEIHLSLAGISFEMHFAEQVVRVQSPLLGRFNVDNLLAVAGVLLANGLELGEVAKLISQLSPVDGRMNRFGGFAGKPLVVVDYAHTPDALEQVLITLRAHSEAHLICVFGCGGDRDRSKRPLMAASAEQWADVIFVTDDNPRSESGDSIVADICVGFEQADKAHILRNRREAIKQAIAKAGPADIVLIAGKGHETYQEINGVKSPFDDSAIAAEFLEVAA
jgi:UDP-N-acetylmuramoyl-L-alanyl-D-glutamate--2,6-diaminopimelate ligase